MKKITFRTKLFNATKKVRQRGFSLIEIALVLVIVGLSLGGIISAFGPQFEQRKYAATQDQLKEVTEALYGYAVLNGRLPCPAVIAADNGKERLVPVVPPTLTKGECANKGQGFLPAAELGLPNLAPLGSPNAGLFIDAWGYPLRYAVSQQNYTPSAGQSYVLTRKDGIKDAKADGTAGVDALNNIKLRVCSTWTAQTTACAAGQEVAQPAFIVFSTGRNGKVPDGNDEAKNTNKVTNWPLPAPAGIPADLVYVSHAKSELTGNSFDDLFYWQSVSSLVSRVCKTPSC